MKTIAESDLKGRKETKTKAVQMDDKTILLD